MAAGRQCRGVSWMMVQPKLLDVVEGDYVIRCDTLDFGVASGPSAGLVRMAGRYPCPALHRHLPARPGRSRDGLAHLGAGI